MIDADSQAIYRTEIFCNKLGFVFREKMIDVLTDQKISISPFKQFAKYGRSPDDVFTSKRGVITRFTSGSKRRMFEAIIKVGELPSYFLTLTYPSSFPSGKDSNRMLFVFLQRYTRRGFQFIWRLEPQKRGAPHYHILCYGVDKPTIEEMSALWVRRMIDFNRNQPRSKRSAVAHIKEHAVKAEPLANGSDSVKKVFLYVGKYLSKAQELLWRSRDLGYVDYQSGEIVGDHGAAWVDGKQWGKMGFAKGFFNTPTVEVSGANVSRYLIDIHGVSMDFCRKYHVFSESEDNFFLQYLQDNATVNLSLKNEVS